MPNKKINQLDSRALSSTDLILVGDPTTGTSFKSLVSGLGLVYVPYTGATTNVNLGEFGLTAGQLTLDTTPTGTAAVGTTRWNNTIGSSETTLKGGSVILKNGVDLVARIVNKVTPNTTLTKAAYQAVRVSGAQGQRLAVAFAQANNDANSADTIGLVTETIPTNQEGFIICVGQIENINTTGSLQGETWVDGDVLYLSPTTPGAITKVKPTGAGHIVVIGYVEYAHANNGKIYVKVMNGWELDELHDVSITSVANNEALIYESSSQLWKNKTIATALGFTPVPTTRTLTINGTTFDLSADRSWTIAAGITGSGVSGQVAYWNGTNSQTGSNNLFWDAANSGLVVGNNVLSSFFRLGVNGNIVVSGTSPYITFNTATNSGSTPAYIQFTNATSKFDIVSTGAIEFFSNANARMRLFGTGNLGINTGATDGGQRLQVQGDAFIKGSGNTGSTSALLVQNSSGTEMFTVRNDGRVLMQSVGSISVGGTIQFNNTVGLTNIEGNPNITNGGRLTFLSGGPQSSYIRCLFDTAYVASSGTSTGTTITDNLTINLTGTATGTAISFLANPTITSLAGSSTYRAFQWNNNSGWGLYGAGTANNFLGGNLTVSRTHNAETSIIINNSSDNAAAYSALRVRANGVGEVQLVKFSQSTTAYKICQPGDGVLFNNGSYGDIAILNDRTAGIIKFAAGASSTAQMTLTAAGRLLLGTTTESTFLLDVNGTARVSGLITGNANARLTGLYPYLELKPDGWSSPLYIQSGLNAALSNVGDYTAFQNPTGKGYLFTSGSTNAIHINPTNANVALNGTADSGYRLYINRGTTANGALAVVGGITDFAASTTSYASLQINPGVAPTSPVNGNIWFDGTDLKMRIGGVTKTFTLV